MIIGVIFNSKLLVLSFKWLRIYPVYQIYRVYHIYLVVATLKIFQNLVQNHIQNHFLEILYQILLDFEAVRPTINQPFIFPFLQSYLRFTNHDSHEAMLSDTEVHPYVSISELPKRE